MSEANPLLDKEKVAEGAITEFRFVKGGSSDDQVIQASASDDKVDGIAAHTAADAARVRITKVGIQELKLGGTVARGDLLTSDASGQGVVAAPGTGTNDRYGAVAQKAGVSGDVIPALLTPGIFQGA